jgi:hypothetical protein
MVIAAGNTDKCPHCGDSNRFESVNTNIYSNLNSFKIDSSGQINSKNLDLCRCTSCHEIIVFLNNKMIFPLGTLRQKCPKEVPEELKNDYEEACLVESLSKKASAALARRCLQNLLRFQKITGKNLNEEIDLAIKTLPPYLAESIDAIRQIGNYAAHPAKTEKTGEILDVEAGETEWILNTLEQLFDFYYVAPAKIQEKRDALNAKLSEIGKLPLK